MAQKRAKVDKLGRAHAGSQLQMQIYVNRRGEELSERLLQALPSLAELNPLIRWVSPLESAGFAEYQDEAFLSAVGCPDAAEPLYAFWLVNVYFLSDPNLPTSMEEWRVALRQVKHELGLTDITIPQVADLFLDARDRRELVGR